MAMPIDKILSSRHQPQRYNAPRKRVETGEERNSNFASPNDDSDYSMDSDLAILPPPRRSAASRLNSRQLSKSRNLIMKWIVCLSIIFLLLLFVPRHHVIKEVKLKRAVTILLWNEESSNERWWRYQQCHCTVTPNRNYTDRPIDAVVVNADRAYDVDGLEKIVRSPNFLVVFAAKKPLSLAKNPLSLHGESIFNYSMTYRPDSNLFWTDYYFSTLQHMDVRVHKFTTPDKHALKELSAHLRFKLQLKQRLVVYMMYPVNNSTVQQSLYLQQLRKHIDLSVIETCHEPNECIPYRFMLIFEPSRCPEYVHPQFYMALANFVVPVLIGGGNLSELVPPGSYISADNFLSPFELSEHLMLLSSRPELYAQFFWWHSKYQIHKIKLPYCALCHQLRQEQRQRPPFEFLQWWTIYQCPDPRDFQIGAAT
ncbi:alpha-(1,3)-fucosyltransferase C [Drosophila virilis]|uniref:Fucosyltransferase n=1 Tax=Drosophila virilis TaxID=7244 RepID=A0A0Q9WT75_DROVI|nr:alpha-(1,3)-fucosyltransferase C [Drosophila virilis]KRF84036.1 uncharacterized protein Dvir_GJ26150 [Drosophila virilis]